MATKNLNFLVLIAVFLGALLIGGLLAYALFPQVKTETKEKIVYQDKIIENPVEKIVYKERVVYKDKIVCPVTERISEATKKSITCIEQIPSPSFVTVGMSIKDYAKLHNLSHCPTTNKQYRP